MRTDHRRSLVFRFFLGWGEGLTHGERGARTYNGGLGAVTQRGPGAEPLVGGQG